MSTISFLEEIDQVKITGMIYKKYVERSLLCLLTMVFLSAGCAGSAMDAVARAHVAIGKARKAGAEIYMPVEMARAVAAYELATAAIKEGTIPGYSSARRFALEAEERAISAKEKTIAVRLDRARNPTPSTTPSPAFEAVAHKREKISPIEKKRYIAAARRRIRNAALTNAQGTIAQGKVEVECWISPDGRIIQMLLRKGKPSDPLAQQVLKGLRKCKVDPFPAGMEEDYLKIRIKIDTTGKRRGSK